MYINDNSFQTSLCHKKLSLRYKASSGNGFLNQLVLVGWDMYGWGRHI